MPENHWVHQGHYFLEATLYPTPIFENAFFFEKCSISLIGLSLLQYPPYSLKSATLIWGYLTIILIVSIGIDYNICHLNANIHPYPLQTKSQTFILLKKTLYDELQVLFATSTVLSVLPSSTIKYSIVSIPSTFFGKSAIVCFNVFLHYNKGFGLSASYFNTFAKSKKYTFSFVPFHHEYTNFAP